MVRAATAAACILLCGGCSQETFFCDTPEDCASAGGGGVCESTGYCSFPDPACDTDRRYGDLAPSGLAGTCVPQTQGTGSSSGSASTSGASIGSTDPTLVGSTSSGTGPLTTETDPSATASTSTGSTEGTEGSSTTDTPACCDASCSTCGEACETELVDQTDAGEALGIAVVGTTLVWTTGYTREVHKVDLTTGTSTLLAELPHIITNVTADDEYLYYLSFSNGFVGRINLISGAQSLVTDANTGEGVYEARHGQIVLDDDSVYFALIGADTSLGGAFRAPLEPNPAVPPEEIGTREHPAGIGVDANSIYVSDQSQDALLRFDKLKPAMSTSLLQLDQPGHIYISAEDVYAADGDDVIRVGKDGTGESLLLTTGGLIRGMTADDTHLYVTDIEAGNVSRLSLFDDEVPAQIATSAGAWGVATDCTHVFWCENGTLSVRRQLK
ncbi:MAG: hypothetical protein KUG77_23390 [Nannocystaceae bacterium]|nr:hypothetical protein [Nannocystaceae bacterium]